MWRLLVQKLESHNNKNVGMVIGIVVAETLAAAIAHPSCVSFSLFYFLCFHKVVLTLLVYKTVMEAETLAQLGLSPVKGKYFFYYLKKICLFSRF